MSAASTKTSASPLPSDNSHVFFQGAPPGVDCERSAPLTERKQGKVTVRYDRKELRKRLILEEWIIENLSELYDCEEEMPELEIDIDELLELDSDEERIERLQELLRYCNKPTMDFIYELARRMQGMRKLDLTSRKAF